MRIEKKRGIDKIRIQHNRKLFWVIIVLIVLLIILIWFIVEKSKAEIFITTDRTEYKQGETIKIIVRNDLYSSIFYFGSERFWGIEKFEDDAWKNPAYSRGEGFQLPILERGKEVCYFMVYEPPELVELKSNSEISHEWNQKICTFSHIDEEQPFEPEYIGSGNYRLIFNYGISKSSEDPYELSNPKTIYSNEFTIKESFNQNPKPECTRDSECVPATCCHAESCVPAEKSPVCKGIMCTMVCSGPLDCGAGSCGCVKGKCEVTLNK